jgi:hypothetical protein
MINKQIKDSREQGLRELEANQHLSIGFPMMPGRPDFGPTATEFYRAKHRSGRRGKYWGLHLTAYDVMARWERP